MVRNYNIDLIKICACLGVCALHFYLPSINEFGFSWGYFLFYASTLAIPLFFMVNGYLLLSKDRGSRYYVSRIANIFKVVLSVNVVYYIILDCIYGEIIFHPIKTPIKETIKNLFFQEGFFSVFWFLGALVIIYALMAIIPNTYFTTKNMLIAIAVLITLSLMANGLNFYTHTWARESLFEQNIPQTFRLYNHLNYFFIGGLMARIKDVIIGFMHNKKWIKYLLLLGMLVAIIAASLKCKYLYGPTYVEHLHCSIITMLGAICTFVLLHNLKGNSMRDKIVYQLSSCMMIVYIIHKPILWYTSISNGGHIYSLLLLWIVCFAIAYGIDKIKYIHNFLKL